MSWHFLMLTVRKPGKDLGMFLNNFRSAVQCLPVIFEL